MATMSLKRWRNGNLTCESRDEPMGMASNLAEELGLPVLGPRLGPVLGPTLGPSQWQQNGLLGDGTYGTVYAVTAGGTAERASERSAACKLLDGGTSMYAYQDAAREAFGLGCAGLLQAVAFGDASGAAGSSGAAAGSSAAPAKACPKVGLFMPMLGARIGNSLVPKFPLPTVASLLRPIAESLASMTGMHRDVKPANILVPVHRGQQACIIDFSLATAQTSSNDFNVVTLWYRAPEILLKQTYTNKVDVWAFGIVLFNLITGCHITRASSEDHLDSLLLDLVTYFGLPKMPWAPLFSKLDAVGGGRARFPTSGLMKLESIMAEASGMTVKTPMVRYAAELLSECLRVSPHERADWAKVLASPFWRLGQKASSIPYGPCAIKMAHDCDLDVFLSGATLVPVGPVGYTGPVAESITENRVHAVDHLLHYAAKLGFSQQTAVVAYWLWRYASDATTQGAFERLSACLFLAAAYNEDTRVRAHGWRAWAATWDDPERFEAFRAAVPPVLAAIGGRWPAATLDALWAAAGAAAAAWQVPFVVALAQLPGPIRPRVIQLTDVPEAIATSVVSVMAEMMRTDATSILSRV